MREVDLAAVTTPDSQVTPRPQLHKWKHCCRTAITMKTHAVNLFMTFSKTVPAEFAVLNHVAILHTTISPYTESCLLLFTETQLLPGAGRVSYFFSHSPSSILIQNWLGCNSIHFSYVHDHGYSELSTTCL